METSERNVLIAGGIGAVILVLLLRKNASSVGGITALPADPNITALEGQEVQAKAQAFGSVVDALTQMHLGDLSAETQQHLANVQGNVAEYLGQQEAQTAVTLGGQTATEQHYETSVQQAVAEKQIAAGQQVSLADIGAQKQSQWLAFFGALLGPVGSTILQHYLPPAGSTPAQQYSPSSSAIPQPQLSGTGQPYGTPTALPSRYGPYYYSGPFGGPGASSFE